MTEDSQEGADWCAGFDGGVICGTTMTEYSRDSEGDRWCFHCRKRHEFWWVVMVPAGPSWYGPTAHMEGVQRDCHRPVPRLVPRGDRMNRRSPGRRAVRARKRHKAATAPRSPHSGPEARSGPARPPAAHPAPNHTPKEPL